MNGTDTGRQAGQGGQSRTQQSEKRGLFFNICFSMWMVCGWLLVCVNKHFLVAECWAAILKVVLGRIMFASSLDKIN